MRIATTTLFNCARERLWPFLVEPELQKQWMKGLLENVPTSEGPQRPGSTFRMKIQEGRKAADYRGEVLAHDPPAHLAIRFWGGCFPQGLVMRVDYRLSAQDGQTRLDYAAEPEAGRLGLFLRLMMPLFQLFGKMQLRGFLKTLKRLAEAPAQAA
jgi:hypothetical protein